MKSQAWLVGCRTPQIHPSFPALASQAIERGDKLEAKAKEDAERTTRRLERLGAGEAQIDWLFMAIELLTPTYPGW